MKHVLRLGIWSVVCLCWTQATMAKTSLPDFTELVREGAPAVVNITVTREAPALDNRSEEEMPEFFRR
ncbi:MAG: serine peptidase, partial [Pseudomonadales bacterium]